MTGVADTSAIAAIEARYRELTNLAPIYIWAANPDGTLAFVNSRVLAFTGLSLDEQVEGGWAAMLHPDDLEPFVQRFADAIEAEEPFEMEVRLRSARGEFRWFLNQAVPVRETPHGPLSGFIGSSNDITDRKVALETMAIVADLTDEISTSVNQRDVARVLSSFIVRRKLARAALIAIGGHDGHFHNAIACHADDAAASAVDDLARMAEAEHLDDLLNTIAAFREPAPLGPVAEIPNCPQAIADLRLFENVAGTALVARGRVVGVIVLFMDTDTFDRERSALVHELADRAALIIDNAGLYSESQRRGEELRRANDALQFLADAGVELVSLIIDNETIQRVAALAVPSFADVAIFDALEDDGSLTRLGTAGITPEVEELARSIEGRVDPKQDRTSAALLRGKSVIIAHVRPRHLRLFKLLAPDSANIAALNPRSVLFIPMAVRGQILGVITFIRLGDSPPFQASEVTAVADQLGRRAGLSLDNARLYAEARMREQQAREANVAKDEFLGLISHELRTPITIIAGGAKILARRGATLSEEETSAVVADITRESDRLSAMLEDLLALARIELHEGPQLEPVLLQRLVSHIIDNVTFPRRKIHCVAEAEAGPVAAEPAYIEHVVRNLLSNAHKYSPDGLPIEVRIEARNGEAAVLVLDNGVGVAPDEAERIFDRFYRSGRTNRMASGAGMGLAVCKRLIETMSGTIWARPREVGGLEVGFSLPFYCEEEEL